MKILAIAGSYNSNSINKKIIQSVSKYYKEVDDEIKILDLNDFERPVISRDNFNDIDSPTPILNFVDQINWADLILISFEDNVDWVLSINEGKLFTAKAVFLLATSDTLDESKAMLRQAEEKVSQSGADILGTFSLPEFTQNFVDGKGIVTPLFRSEIEAKIRKTKRVMKLRLTLNQ